MQTDVVVVGGGGAGLAAAVGAASSGARVVLLEKNAALGGTTVQSIGSISASQVYHQRTGIVDSPDEHYEDIERLSKPYAAGPNNDALRRLLADNVSETVRWLSAMGIEFFGPMEAPGHRKPRMYNVVPNSDAYIYHLERHARSVGVQILTNAPARRFVMNQNHIAGVEFDRVDGKAEVVRASRGVVLASGDYAGSLDMKRKFLAPSVAPTEAVNPTNTGDGHRMAMELGAQIVNANLGVAGMRFVAPPSPSWISRLPPARWLIRPANKLFSRAPESIVRRFILAFFKTASVPANELFDDGAILINSKGERFADETKPALTPGSKMIVELASQPEGLAYIVFDARLAERFSRWPHYISTAPGVAYAYLADYERSRPDLFHRGQTPEELATRLNMPPAKLKETIATYNASGGESNHGHAMFARGKRQPLERGPYYALGPVKNYINFTDGGLAINERLQVLDANGAPIPRLFAAGATGQGGLPLRGHGNHIGWIFTSGRMAGKYAAGLEPRTNAE